MTNKPRTVPEIYLDLRDSLAGKITKLSNFTEQSFNRIWTEAFADEVRKLEVKATVSQLAGWIDYTGGPVTQSDLDKLGVSSELSPADVSEYMQEDYLDEYIKIVGVSRLPGSRATGTVDFTTQSEKTTIPSGTVVTTEPDETGNTINFLTTEKAETANGVSVAQDVPIQAEEVGPEYNVPAEKIIRLQSPPVGVKGVQNNKSTTGGENEEPNDELRERAKQAVQSASLGGTTNGIKGYLRQNVEGVGEGDIIIDELITESGGPVDVIVDGGLESDLLDAIDTSRPTGIKHNLIRPEVFQLGFDVTLSGTDVDVTQVDENIEDFLLDGGIGEDFYERELIRQIMNTDEDIVNVNSIGGIIERVTNETIKYDTTQTDYRLEYTYEKDHGSIEIRDENGVTYTQGPTNDYTVEDQTGDGWPETIVWQGNAEPDDGEDFFVDYDVTVPSETIERKQHSTDLVRDEIFTFNLNKSDTFEFNNTEKTYELDAAPFNNTVSIQDENSTSYTEDTDWQLVPITEAATEDTFDYASGKTDYTLSEEVTVNDVGVIDGNGEIYVEGTDYELISTDTDGTNDTISWDTNNSTPADGVEFTVNYNGYAETIRWDTNNSNPAQGDDFTVTYDQELYPTEYDIIETPKDEIQDESGDTYTEGKEYEITNDGEKSAILWTTDPASLTSKEEFYFTYLNQGDIFFGDRQKYDPGQIDVNTR